MKSYSSALSRTKKPWGWLRALLLLSILAYPTVMGETDATSTSQTFSKFSENDLEMLGVITPPEDAFIQEEYKGIKLVATPQDKYTAKELALLKYFIDRTPSALMAKGPSAIINAEVGFLPSQAQASGPYVYFDTGSFSTGGFFSAGSLEGVFREFIHELVHVYQFRQALEETDLTKAREKFRRLHSQTHWDYVVMKSSLVETFAAVTEWKLITYEHVDGKSAELEDIMNAKTSKYGRVSIIEDMAETVSLVTIGDLTKLSKERVQWALDLLGYKSPDEALRDTFPYAELYEEVGMAGSPRFDDSKEASYKQQYPIADITYFVSESEGKNYQKIVSFLERGFQQRGWEMILSKDLVLKNQVKKHIFEYQGRWRDLYVEVISYEDATGYLSKPEKVIITVLSGYKVGGQTAALPGLPND